MRAITVSILGLVITLAAAEAVQLTGPQQSVPPEYFGMHIHGLDVPRPETGRVTPWPAVPFGSWRLISAYVTWGDIEPQEGSFDFKRLDKYVALAEEKHVRVLLPLYATPRWAALRPDEKGSEGMGAASEPAHLGDWERFVRAIATRYKGRIEAYEIWNEPNYRGYWTGSIDHLVTMTRQAYEIIKSIDPAALVVLPAPTTETGPKYLDEFLKAGGGQYGDVVGYHFYVHAKPPEAMAALGTQIKDILSTNNVHKPIWNTEAGWDQPQPFPSEELAAAYVARAYLLLWAAGVSRFYWYSWDNHKYMELIERDDVTLKPAARAYAAVNGWLAGATVKSCQSDPAENWVCQLKQGESSQWILWNAKGNGTFVVTPAWHVNQMTPLLGSPQPLADNTLHLGQTPVLVE